MMKRKLDETHELVVSNGIAMIKDGSTGTGISLYPNISATGSIRGMKAKGWWGKDDKIVKAHGLYFNVSRPQRPPEGKWEKICAEYDEYY